MAEDDVDTTTRRTTQVGLIEGGARILNIVTDAGASAVVLPSSGTLVLGRAHEADVRVRSRSVSRRHARLRIGDEVMIEDLGSANGTWVRARTLAPDAPVALTPGEVFHLGDVLCMLSGTLSGTRRFWPMGHLHKRIDAWLSAGTAAAVLRVRGRGFGPGRMESTLLGLLGEADLAASLAPADVLVALSGRDVNEAEEVAAMMLARLGDAGGAATLGLASAPRHGTTAAALLAHATRSLDAGERGGGGDVIVRSPTLVRLHAMLDRVAAGSINVLLLGETGVGKEVFAARLHARSSRAGGPYVKFNCAALTESLVEAELFGHEKGAFSGAAGARAGLIEAAHGGTLLLDEVGELSLNVQAKLLRALEGRAVRRLGSTQERPVDVRFVAATNRDLEADCAAGRFRSDLYFRLNGITLRVPPLRERSDELEELARRFLARAAAQIGLPAPPALGADALAALRAYAWPGNIRELRNVIERAVLLCDGAVISAEDCAITATEPADGRPSEPPSEPLTIPPAPVEALAPRELEERQRIVAALERCLWNQSQAARLLGISRKVLLARLDRYNLPRPHKGRT